MWSLFIEFVVSEDWLTANRHMYAFLCEPLYYYLTSSKKFDVDPSPLLVAGHQASVGACWHVATVPLMLLKLLFSNLDCIYSRAQQEDFYSLFLSEFTILYFITWHVRRALCIVRTFPLSLLYLQNPDQYVTRMQASAPFRASLRGYPPRIFNKTVNLS